MTLYVNARFLTQKLSGVQRYARELLGAFDAAGPPGRVVALCPEGEIADPGWSRIELRRVPGGQGHLWEQGPLARAAREGVLLSLCSSGPLRHPAHVLALHDANVWRVPAAFDWRYRLLHRRLRPALARRAARLVTVSRHSARDLGAVLGIDPARFDIVPNSAEHILRVAADPGALARYGLRPGGYLLAVGSAGPNKNIAALVAAHALGGSDVPPLVLAGGGLDCLRGVPPGPGIRQVGQVSDGALRALYEGARGFVFPSLNEGFGIPPLEAMSLGTPVLAARTGALPEVLGDAALWCDPSCSRSLAEGLRQLSGLTPAQRQGRAQRGLARACRFSWAASAAELSAVLQAAAPGHQAVA